MGHRGTSLYIRRPNHENKSAPKPNKGMDAKKKKKALPTKRKTVDEIMRVVDAFSISDKREILSQMKVLIEQNADGAKEILISNPQLAQALLLIQMEFNLVKKQDVQALTQNVSNQIAMQTDENEEKKNDDAISMQTATTPTA